MPLTKPLNNNVLVEIIREDDLVSRADDNESMKEGKLIDYSISRFHLTASSTFEFRDDGEWIANQLKNLLGGIVRWEEFAEGGQTFEENGKKYALIPWWRLIGFKEADK